MNVLGNMARVTPLLAIAICLVCVGAGSTTEQQRVAKLKRGDFFTDGAVIPLPSDSIESSGRQLKQDITTLYLIGLDSTDQLGELSQLLSNDGGFIFQYVPIMHYLVVATKNGAEAIRQELGATVAPYPQLHKIDPEMDHLLNGAAFSQSGGSIKATSFQDKAQLYILIGSQTREDVQGLLLSWSGPLLALLGIGSNDPCAPALVALSATVAQSSICSKDVPAVAAWLSEQPLVSWVEQKQSMQLHNIYASAISQSGAMPLGPLDGGDPRSPDLHPYWGVGLDGTGQIVGVADTGLSMDSCYFYDNIDYLKNATLDPIYGAPYFASNTHRKVALLYGWTSLLDLDGASGHGTHVAGSIAGSAYGTNATLNPDFATGMAPNARLAFVNIGNAAGSLDIPYNKWDVTYAAGARIHSDSWGAPTTTYTMDSYLLDEFLWNHQEFVNIRSAGNDGANYTPESYDLGVNTIGAPGNAKNALTIGAARNWLNTTTLGSSTLSEAPFITPNINQAEYNLAVSLEFSLMDASTNETFQTYTVPAQEYYSQNGNAGTRNRALYIGTIMDLNGTTLEVVSADPSVICNSTTQLFQLPSFQGIQDKAVLAPRTYHSYCKATNKTLSLSYYPYLQAAKPALAIVGAFDFDIWTPHEDLAMVLPNSLIKANVTTPSLLLGNNSDAIAVRLALFDDNVRISVTVKVTDLGPPYESLMVFSSYGLQDSSSESWRAPGPLYYPVEEGRSKPRYKPDIVAPGVVLSALHRNYNFSIDNCGTMELRGTSMATPVVSGLAAIIRQYFMDGFYPSGARNPSASMIPSGALIKAMLVAGAAEMKGMAFAPRQMFQGTPDGFQGHGRVDLSRSLPLAGDKRQWKLQVFDRVPIYGNTSNSLNVTTTGKGPLIVVLSYYDFPSFVGTSLAGHVVNNVKLSVTTSTGKTYWGNNDAEDYENTIKRVLIPNPGAGQYTVNVAAATFLLDIEGIPAPTIYSLVVLGGIQQQAYPPPDLSYQQPPMPNYTN